MEQKQQYIQGYYRHKQDKSVINNQSGSAATASTALGGSVFCLALAHWEVSLTIVLLASVTYAVVKYQKQQVKKAELPQLRVNYMNKSTTVYL